MHGAYVGIGAFGTGYLVVDQGWALEPAILVAACVGTAIGAVVGLPALRLSGLQFAIASLAFAAFASSYLFRLDQLRFSRFLDRRELLGVDLFDTYSLFLVMIPVIAVCYLAVWRVRRSTYGALLLASRDAPLTVAHFGADPRRARMAAFTLASFIATLGGCFYGILLTAFRPEDFAFQLSLILLLYAVIGGIESLAGPLIAGIAFGVVPELFAGEASTSASALPDIISGVVVIALMAARPAGVASFLRRRRVNSAAPWRFGRWGPVVDNHHPAAPPEEPAVKADATSGQGADEPVVAAMGPTGTDAAAASPSRSSPGRRSSLLRRMPRHPRATPRRASTRRSRPCRSSSRSKLRRRSLSSSPPATATAASRSTASRSWSARRDRSTPRSPVTSGCWVASAPSRPPGCASSPDCSSGWVRPLGSHQCRSIRASFHSPRCRPSPHRRCRP
jgi:branched-chain amino acid transport system permease protein